MLTPRFEITQDDSFVTVLIQTPYVKISDVDFFISGTEFKFYVKPYFLRLNLPGEVIEDGREAASYDVEKGTFTVKLPKAQPGQFEGLDMLTSLLAPKKKPPSALQPLIEVVENEKECTTSSAARDNDNDSSSDFDWEIEQLLPEDDVKLNLEESSYGFADQKSGVFHRRQEELHEVADIPNPESMTPAQKRAARLMAEDLKFDPDHYLADYFDDESIQHLLSYEPPWNAEYQQSLGKRKVVENPNHNLVELTEQEKDKLRRLPNKEYLIDDNVQMKLLLGLVDIIFAYAYNYRTTEGENTVESAWSINKISSTLSWFENFTSLRDIATACCRRCLSYPLHRNWKLVQRVLDDTKSIFCLGRRQILKCLLETHDLFNEDDPRYILNDLYITDYCVWMQSVSNKKLKSLATSLKKIEVKKADVGWQLDELEAAALAVKDEDKNSSTDINNSADSSSDRDSESSDTESSDGESSDTESDSESRESGSDSELKRGGMQDSELLTQDGAQESNTLDSESKPPEENLEIKMLSETTDERQKPKIVVLSSEPS